jgi:hypothetical protein
MGNEVELRWLVLGKRKVLQIRKLMSIRRANPFDKKSKRIKVWSPWDEVPSKSRPERQGEEP